MNRREMFHQGFHNLTKALPALLDVVGGFGWLLKPKEGMACQRQATCFPKSHKKPEASDGQESKYKEE